MKLQISMASELVKRADKFAKENYLTRSALISVALNQYISSNEITKAIVDLSISMRKIADTGKIDEETQKKLQDFERVAQVIASLK